MFKILYTGFPQDRHRGYVNLGGASIPGTYTVLPPCYLYHMNVVKSGGYVVEKRGQSWTASGLRQLCSIGPQSVDLAS